MTEAEQAAELGDILDTLVKWREIRREAQLRREAAGEPPPPLNYVDFTKPPAPIWFGRMKEAAKDGGAASLDASIRECGWRAYAEGGLEAMHELVTRACGDDAYRHGIVDHCWDGIGTERGGYWFC